LDKGTLTLGSAAELLKGWHQMNSVLAIEPDTIVIPEKVHALVHEREAARSAKDWKQSDALRDEIAALGWIVKDTKEGAKLSPK